MRVNKEWKKLTPEFCTKLMHEMPARLNEIHRVNGKKIHPSFKPSKYQWACKCDVCMS